MKRALVVIGAAILLSGCGGSLAGGGGFKDVESVEPKDADSYTLLNNVDGYPNIVRVCYEGVAFATTTRDAAGAILRVPEWDASCKETT
jgi:hypothetical protein